MALTSQLVPDTPFVDHGRPATVPQKTVHPVAPPVAELAASELALPVVDLPVGDGVVAGWAWWVAAPAPLEPPQAAMAGTSAARTATTASARARDGRWELIPAAVPGHPATPAPPLDEAASPDGQVRPGTFGVIQ